MTNQNKDNKVSEDNNELSSSKIHSFHPGDSIQVEVTSFGPLGASVEVVGLSHDGELLPANQEPFGTGLILQKEIAYFRKARDNVDVVRGEILNAYVQKVREEDGKLDISLRKYGGKAKSDDVATIILERLKWTPGGIMNVGEKSSPKDIENEFPGVSKSVFKKALGGLYKKSLVKPGPDSIELIKKE
jgi:predicted RNA-binding protein (virulence factor B family)